MFYIDNNGKITITKGDDGEAELALNAGTIESPVLYELQAGDTVNLYAYPKGTKWNDSPFITKTYTIEDVTTEGLVSISFVPNDTNQIKPGEYAYRVRLTKNSGTVNTVVDENTFEILK